MTTTLAPVRAADFVLLERVTGGVLFELLWNGQTGALARLRIRITEPGQEPRYGHVPADKGLDAFEHPYAYLATS